MDGNADARMAAIVAKHSVQTFISVTRLRRGRLEWQHVPSVSTCEDSGRSSHMSTYSFASIFLVSFGGTELKPGRLAKSPDGLDPAGVGVVVAAIGHASRAAGLSGADVLGEAIEKTGREAGGPVIKAPEDKQQLPGRPATCHGPRAAARASWPRPTLSRLYGASRCSVK